MSRDHLLGSSAVPSRPLGPPTFEPGDSVRFKPPYMDRKIYTVSRVVGSGRKADVWFVGGGTGWAMNLERVAKRQRSGINFKGAT
jgi:hypothetical protein